MKGEGCVAMGYFLVGVGVESLWEMKKNRRRKMGVVWVFS